MLMRLLTNDLLELSLIVESQNLLLNDLNVRHSTKLVQVSFGKVGPSGFYESFDISGRRHNAQYLLAQTRNLTRSAAAYQLAVQGRLFEHIVLQFFMQQIGQPVQFLNVSCVFEQLVFRDVDEETWDVVGLLCFKLLDVVLCLL